MLHKRSSFLEYMLLDGWKSVEARNEIKQKTLTSALGSTSEIYPIDVPNREDLSSKRTKKRKHL